MLVVSGKVCTFATILRKDMKSLFNAYYYFYFYFSKE